MLDLTATESMFLKIHALACAAGYLWEPDERELHDELVELIEVLARRAAKDIYPENGGGHDESSILRTPQRGGESPECQQGSPRGADDVA